MKTEDLIAVLAQYPGRDVYMAVAGVPFIVQALSADICVMDLETGE